MTCRTSSRAPTAVHDARREEWARSGPRVGLATSSCDRRADSCPCTCSGVAPRRATRLPSGDAHAYYVLIRSVKRGSEGRRTPTDGETGEGARAVGHAAERQAAPGNYLGALANWVKLQDSLELLLLRRRLARSHDDLDTSDVPGNTRRDAGRTGSAAGLDPERSTLFIQSLVPEHAELHLLFSMTTPVTWLERVPTYRERIEQQHLESPPTAPGLIRCCSPRTS